MPKKGKKRKEPGTTGKGRFYRVEVRPKGDFTTFRNQDVGEHGHLERVAGKRPSGSWDTASWLVSKEDASVDEKGELVVDDTKAKSMFGQVRGPIKRVKGDIFKARPRRNVPESEKPTARQRRARAENIKKAQASRKKRR